MGEGEQVIWDAHIYRTQKGASEQILVVVGINPTLDVAHTGTVAQFLDKERLVYLPSLSPDDGGEGELRVTRDNVDGGLAIVSWHGEHPWIEASVGRWREGGDVDMFESCCVFTLTYQLGFLR